MKYLIIIFLCVITLSFVQKGTSYNETAPLAIPKWTDDTTFYHGTKKVEISSEFGFYSSPTLLSYLTETTTDTLTGKIRIREFYKDTTLYKEEHFLEGGELSRNILLSKTGDTIFHFNFEKNEIVSYHDKKFISRFKRQLEGNKKMFVYKYGEKFSKNIKLDLSLSLFNSQIGTLFKVHQKSINQVCYGYNVEIDGAKFPLYNVWCDSTQASCVDTSNQNKLNPVLLSMRMVHSIAKEYGLTDSIAPFKYEFDLVTSNSAKLIISSTTKETHVEKSHYDLTVVKASVDLNSGQFAVLDTNIWWSSRSSLKHNR